MVMWSKGYHKIGYSGGSKRVGWSFMVFFVVDFKALFKYIEGRSNNQFSKRRAKHHGSSKKGSD